jgi:16S rRNA (uracil1498-N3)-methyltransferase
VTAAPWFIAPPECWDDDRISLPEDESRHAVTVLKVAEPDVITVTNGEGVVATCAVSRTGAESLEVEILEVVHHPPTRPEVVVYQATAKSSKLDGSVQQLAELGVASFDVFESSRSVAHWDARKLLRLHDRWTAIARGAAKQSRNPWVMRVGQGLTIEALIAALAHEPMAVVLWEEAELPLRAALVADVQRVVIVVGPEGGLTSQEAEMLSDAGGRLASLGPRILRSEHAAAATVAAVSFHYGALG